MTESDYHIFVLLFAICRMFISNQLFNKAAEDVKNLKEQPDNDDLLQLYGLYKQATVGDVNTGNHH